MKWLLLGFALDSKVPSINFVADGLVSDCENTIWLAKCSFFRFKYRDRIIIAKTIKGFRMPFSKFVKERYKLQT